MIDSEIPTIRVSNSLNDPLCTGLRTCKRLVRNYQQRLIGPYISDTVSSVSDVSSALASIEMSAKVSEEVYESLRTVHSGNGLRQVKKAAGAGYSFAEFDWNKCLDDVHEINHSKAVRSGGKMKQAYLRDANQLADSTDHSIGVDQPCPRHYIRSFGVLLERDLPGQGYGNKAADLVAYVRLKRQGDIALYGQILGHGDHLNAGVMYFLHWELISQLERERLLEVAPRHIVYNRWISGGPGLQMWKKRCGFRPRFFVDASDTTGG